MLADVRYAVRQLRKSPGFAATAVLTLALGIGANTAIFSVMHAVLLRTLPVRDPQQLFYLTHQNGPDSVGSTGDYPYTYGINVYNRMREDRSVFSDVIAYVPLSFNKTAVRSGAAPEEIEADEVSGNFFSALGVGMAQGTGFASADEDKHAQVAVLSYGYWTRRFQRNPGVIGQAIYVNGVPMTVLGVAAPRFYGVESGGRSTDLWVPLQNRPELNAWGLPATGNTLYGSPNWWNLMLMARLRPGVTQAQALARMNPLFAEAAWETVRKEIKRGSVPLELAMVPARGLGTASKDYKDGLHVLMGMVALVLVIACVNIAMLLAARNAAREREFAMRMALGASRWPIFRQLLAESLLLVGSGAGLGWLFALSATRLLAAWSELEVSLAPDGSVLLFTLAVSVGRRAGLWARATARCGQCAGGSGPEVVRWSVDGEPEPCPDRQDSDRGANGSLRGAAVWRGTADPHPAQLSERRPGDAGRPRAGFRRASRGRKQLRADAGVLYPVDGACERAARRAVGYGGRTAAWFRLERQQQSDARRPYLAV